MEDLSGKQFGTYRIVEPLGEGGMAAVFKAYQASMDRLVAIKVLPKQLATDPRFIGRFTQEAMLLAKLQHTHILPVFDYGQSEGYTYLVMPLIKSGTLAKQFTGKPLPLKRIRTVISQVGDALDYAHSQGLVHRDIKPSNVLLDERGNCLLSDFGIARIIEGTAQFTSSGGIIGTPAYMSPEQGRGDKVDARTDIYSLGIMLYEMAVGRVPFQAETPVAVIFKHIQEPLPMPHKFNPDLPEAVEHVIFKALAKDPNDRYQTAGEMVAALQAAIPDTVSQPVHVSPSVETLVKPAPPPIAREEEAATAPAVPQKKKGLPALAWAGIGLGILVLCLGSVVIIDLATKQLGWLGITAPTRTVIVSRTSPPDTALGRQTAAPTRTEIPGATPMQTTGSASTRASQTMAALQTAISGATPTQTTAPVTATNKRIAFSSNRNGNYEIYVMNADGSNVINLTNSGDNEYAPIWSPDGSKIIYHTGDEYDSQIYVMGSNGQNRVNLTNKPGTYNCYPVWSPDGSQIAFNSTRDGNFEVYKMNADGSGQTNLTRSPGMDRMDAWSPDGQKIAFYSERDGNAEIYVMNSDGSNQTRLTNNSINDAGPAWSPDGRKIAYHSGSGSNTGIYTMYPDGSHIVRLTSGGPDAQPMWSSDGNRIVFYRHIDGNYEIYVMNSDGSNLTRLTNNSADDITPSWEP